MPIRTPRLALLLLAATLLPGTPLHAVSKDMIQLQTQIQQLQDSVARLQQANDERMGALQSLVQQTADQVTKITATTDAVQRQLQTQQEAGGGKIDQVSGQVQALNDSLDEIKARLGRLEKLMQDARSQQQSIPAPSEPAPSAAAPISNPDTSSLPPTSPTAAPDGFSNASAQPIGRNRKPSAATPADAAPATTAGADAAAAAVPAAPVDQLYKTALGDYMSAKYGLAASEFSDVTRAYPTDALAGNAFYYQGEIDYRGARYANAVRNYDRVLEQFPDSNKVPAAHLHKGQALIQLKQTDAAIREFRTLTQRFPNSPEALQAKTRLTGLGATPTARAR